MKGFGRSNMGKSSFLFIILLHLLNVYKCASVNMNVVVVFEKNYELAKRVIDTMFKLFLEKHMKEVKIDYQPISVNDNDTETSVCDKIIQHKPTILIDTTRRPSGSNSRAGSMVKKVTRKMGIPTISATYGKMSAIDGWQNPDPIEMEFLVPISPPGYSIQQSIRDIVEAKEIPTTGILCEDSIDMDNISAAIIGNVATRVIVRSVPKNRDKIKDAVLSMKTGEIQYFFVLGYTDFINLALEFAANNNMTGEEFTWIGISMDEQPLKCSMCMKAFMLSLQPISPVAKEKKELLETIGKEFKYPSQMEVSFYYDLVLMVLKTAEKLIANGSLPAEMSYAQCTSGSVNLANRENIKLRSALNTSMYEGMFGKFNFSDSADIGSNQQIRMIIRKITFMSGQNTQPKRLGEWENGWQKGTFNLSMENEKEFKQNFTAIKIYQVTTLITPPFIQEARDENGREFFEGYCVDLLDEIKKIVGFEYQLFKTPSNKYGEQDLKTMKWDGMMGDLTSGKAHIALGPIAVMAERETVVDFTVPYYDLVGISILMKKPSIPSSLFKFLTVLEASVWGCILAAYFFTSFLMYLFDRLSPYSYYNNKEKYADDDEDEKRDFSLKESLWFCMTSLTPQGGGEAPRNLSGRLVAATWWLFGFIIIASYTANLAAFLTVSRLDSPIESLDDLAKQYKIKYAPQEETSAEKYFRRMAYIEDKFYEIWKNMSLDDSLNDTERANLAVWDYPVSDKYTKIWWTMKETGLPKTFEEGVDKVLASKGGSSEGFAFIADATEIKYAVMTSCELIQVGSEFSRKPLALAVKQGSSLKDQISSAILKLLNQRRLESLKEKWWNRNANKKECDDSEQQSDGISIANIGGVFIVIFIGVVLACITLATEYWFYKKKKNNNVRVVTVKQYPQKNRNRH